MIAARCSGVFKDNYEVWVLRIAEEIMLYIIFYYILVQCCFITGIQHFPISKFVTWVTLFTQDVYLGGSQG